MPSWCRGVVVASNTNRARTQMAEGFLRVLTTVRLHVTSGAVHRATTTLPQAVAAMKTVGVDIAAQSPSSLAPVLEKISTFDVFVSIDAVHTTKASPEHSHNEPSDVVGDVRSVRHANAENAPWDDGGISYDPMLVPHCPAHWTVGSDAADVREQWRVWSPRNPMIAHENSTRKFQDHLYDGEPLFRTLSSDNLRHKVRLQYRWLVPCIDHKYALERSDAYLARVCAARNAVFGHAVSLIRALEAEYDESLMDEARCASISKCIIKESVA